MPKDEKTKLASDTAIAEQRKKIEAQSNEIAEQAKLVARLLGGEEVAELLGEDIAEDVEGIQAPDTTAPAKLKAKL
jgi:hypothetical protein